MLQEKLLEKDMVLVIYDFDTSEDGNRERNAIRQVLTSKPFYAKMMNQSCYFFPASLASLSAVRKWASNIHADIKVFGIDTTLKDKRNLAHQYVEHLHGVVGEVNEIGVSIWEDLKNFEERTADAMKLDDLPKMQGWHRKLEGVSNRFSEIQSLIHKVGGTKDEFELFKLNAFIKEISGRYEHARKARDNRIGELKE